MENPNIFFGESCKAQFVNIIYKHLISREWFTNADVMAEYMNLTSAKDLPCSVTKCDSYTQLKKAFNEIKNELSKALNCNCIETKGDNRNKHFRYTGNISDPLAEMRKSMAINSIRKYWQFCQDSAGFFPTSWLDYFFKDCKDLIAIKKKRQEGKQILTSSLDSILTNIDLLPMLYEAINNKTVLFIKYKPYEEKEPFDIIFHPQYLREYNGRWHLFGHAVNNVPEWTYDIAIDRIIGKPRELYKVEYMSAPYNFYENFFKNKVGVSQNGDNKAKDIIVRAHTIKMYKLTETKPIHSSQKTLSAFEQHADGTYGDFEIHVEVNNELIGRILQMGDGLEIVSPEEVRNIFKERINNMQKFYENYYR